MFVGRIQERARIEELLASARDGRSAALVVRGDAGMGKTRLLDEAAEIAGEDFRLLRTTGVESEAELPYATLHQLLHPLLPSIPALPEPQRRSLRSAFGLDARHPADRMLVGLGVLTLLANAAEQDALLCLVDDAQWVDAESRDALGFATRRFAAERIAVLMSIRDGTARPVVIPGVAEMHLAPLSPKDSRTLLTSRFGETLAGDAVANIVRNAAGNPLALLELARDADGEASEVPSIEQGFVDRIRRLPPETGTLLLLAAADRGAELGLVARAAAVLGIELDALEPAELEGLVSVQDGEIRFRHPLLRSAAYRAGTFAQRRRVHHALADALEDESDADRQAWHRAAAAVGKDEGVALGLETTAERAAARGGYAAAATALARAGDLSSLAADRARRCVAAAEAARLAGQHQRALELLDGIDIAPEDIRLSVEAARTRGAIETQAGNPATAMRIFLDAATAIHTHDRARALELVTLAQDSAGRAGAITEAVEFGGWAERLEPAETREEKVMLGLVRGFADILLGNRERAASALGDSARAGADSDDPRVLVWAGTAAMFLGQEQSASDILSRAISQARAHGAIGVLPYALHLLAGVERRLGRLGAAWADADESLRLARETSQEGVAAGALSTLTELAAIRGEDAEAEAFARAARDLAVPRHLVVVLAGVARGLAALDLARGRAADALERLAPVVGLQDTRKANNPYALFSTPLFIEAAARTGRIDGTQARLRAFDEWAQEGELGWACALAERCRALLAPNEAEAERRFSDALTLHNAHPQPFERARTALLFGEMLRRGRRKSEARQLLREALETFEDLGARAWADRAAAEVRATGATARKRVESTRDDLTPQELQIVRLVAAGKTNPETAAQLFLSPKTVQYHLRKVFLKLEISSRGELVRLVAEGSLAEAL